MEKIIKKKKFDVLITSYESFKQSASYLKKIKFQELIFDEAHKLKNEES